MTSVLIKNGAHRSATIKHLATFIQPAAGAKLQPLPDIRAQIWKLRTEYWYRRATSVPTHLRQAKAEFHQAWEQKISQPATWTWADLATGMIYAVNISGAFVLGEVLARGDLQGYPVDDKEAHH